jgi:lipopolysaccharide export system permease protein
MTSWFNSIKKLKVLDRYLIREFLSPFFLAVGGFAVIAIVDILFYIVELFVLSGVSFLTAVRLLVYKLPAVMVLFFPMSTVFATMLLYVRMAKDNELSVLRTSGIQPFRIIMPVILLGILISYGSFIFNDVLVPISNQAADSLIRRELKKSPPPSISQNTVFKDSNRFFYIKQINGTIMDNIMVIEETFSTPRLIIAKKGEWKEFKWTLYDGLIQEFEENGNLKYVNNFKEMRINVQKNIRSYYKRQKKPREMDSQELKDKISDLNESGLGAQAYKTEYYLKYSLPATCFIFVLVGISYCFSFVKTGKDWWGVIIAICTSVLSVGFYFVLMAIFRAFAKGGEIPAVVGAWTPNSIYFIITSSIIYYQCKYR